MKADRMNGAASEPWVKLLGCILLSLVSASACSTKVHDPELCSMCSACQECVSDADGGVVCQPMSKLSLQCGVDGAIHSFDSCGDYEGILESCPENADCEEQDGGEPICACRNSWGGEGCETCPVNWDPDSDCSSCVDNWDQDENCQKCLPNWDQETGCTACLGSWDLETECTACQDHWLDEGNNCGSCVGNWDPNQGCAVCENSWVDNGNDCTTCPGNWDPLADCGACLPGWDPNFDCGQCLQGLQGEDCSEPV